MVANGHRRRRSAATGGRLIEGRRPTPRRVAMEMPDRRRAIRRTLWLMLALALAFYLGFIWVVGHTK